MEGIAEQGSPEARLAKDALALHYDEGEALYKFWASPFSVLSAIVLGWERSRHPGQLHYGWDLDHGLSLDESIRYPMKVVLEHLGLASGRSATVAELGCGIGGSAADFSLQAPYVDLIGLSIVARQIEVANRRKRCRRLRDAHYLVADFGRLPFGENSFHGAFAIESLCHVATPEKRAVLAGILHTLKPGARLVVLDAYRNPAVDQPVLQPAYEAMKHGWAFPDLVTSEGFVEEAGRSGLRCLACLDVTERILAASGRIGAIASPLLGFSQGVAQAIEARPLRRFASSLRSKTGLLTSFAVPMLKAAVAQHELFARRFLSYHLHVFVKP